MHTGNQLKNKSNTLSNVLKIVALSMSCGVLLSPVFGQGKHPTTPLKPQSQAQPKSQAQPGSQLQSPLHPQPVTPAAVTPRAAGVAAPPLPVVVELFVTGDDAANKAALALLKSLPAKMSNQNILIMSEHVARDKAGNYAPGTAQLVQRHFELHDKYKVNNLKAPLMVVDGVMRVLPLTEEGVRKAIADVRKENRQLVTVDASISGKNLKINVFADSKRRVTDNCRIGAFIWASPIDTSVADAQEPVVRQVVDFGYLNCGHKGANTTVVALDKSWYNSDLYKQLNIVAVIQNCDTGRIIGASGCIVQKSKEGWF